MENVGKVVLDLDNDEGNEDVVEDVHDAANAVTKRAILINLSLFFSILSEK